MAPHEDQWESYRNTLRVLYLLENKTLKQVKEYMEKTYGFVATEWQFENKLQREWGFTKKLRKADWCAIDYHMKMRIQNEGKETVVINSGTPITSKKLRKELSRYCKRSVQVDMFQGGNTVPRLPKSVTLRTPPPRSPVVRPQGSVARRSKRGKPQRGQLPDVELLDCDNCPTSTTVLFTEEMDVDLVEEFLTSLGAGENNSQVAAGQALLDEEMTSDQVPWDDFMTEDFDTMSLDGGNLLLIPGGKYFHLLFNIPWFRFLDYAESSGVFDRWGTPTLRTVDNKDVSFTSAMISSLQTFVPERYEGENSKLLLEPSNKSLITQLLQTGAFYLTNSMMISDESRYGFLTWVFQQKSQELLKPFLQLQLPTVQAISAKILEGILWGSSTNAFRFIVESGIDGSLLTGRRGHRYLFMAIMKNNVEIVRDLLLKGAHADPGHVENSESRLSSLEHSAMNGNAEMLRLLLIAGPTPLHRWRLSYDDLNYLLERAVDAYSGHEACILLLIEQGANVDALYDLDVTHGEPSILDYAYLTKGSDLYTKMLPSSKKSVASFTLGGVLDAARRGEKEFMHYSSGVGRADDPNRQIVLESALFYAIPMKDHYTAQTVLLEAGVNPNVPLIRFPQRNNMRRGPIIHFQVKQFLNTSCPLQYAADTGDLELLDRLVKYGADINGPSGILSAAAARAENSSVLRHILGQGADIEMFGRGALISAVNHDQIENCKILAQAGVDLNEGYHHFKSESYLHTPLMEAVSRRHFEIAKFLIQHGAKVNYTEFPGFLPLLVRKAIQSADSNMVGLILSAGAEPALRSGTRDWFEVVLDVIASDMRNAAELVKILELLIVSCSPVRGANASLTLAASISTDTALIQRILDLGVDVNSRHGVWFHARTPIQGAASLQSIDVLKLLLDAGADINSPASAKGGRTALQAVCCCNTPKLDVVQFLLDNGADVNALPARNSGYTALQVAAIQGHIHIALCLLDAGADVNADGAERGGLTALEGAAINGRLDMVQLLLNAGATNGIDSAIKKAESNSYFAVADLIKDHVLLQN